LQQHSRTYNPQLDASGGHLALYGTACLDGNHERISLKIALTHHPYPPMMETVTDHILRLR
jgi:hypothetical protein